MLTRLLHTLVADPRVYNVVSILLGSPIIKRRLRKRATAMVQMRPGLRLTIVDVGGGTGNLEDLWPAGSTYICLDPDERKVSGFVRRGTGGRPLIARGDRLPFQDQTIDVVLLVAVSHHLSRETLDAVLADMARVLKPTGQLLYLDAVWNPRYVTGRLLWHYDRGAYPRRAEVLSASLEHYFICDFRERYGLLHDYITWAGVPAPK